MAATDFVTEGQVDSLVTALVSAVNSVEGRLDVEESVTATFNANLVAGVLHASDDSVGRPAAVLVIWVGTVPPTNAISTDIVIRTDEAVTP